MITDELSALIRSAVLSARNAGEYTLDNNDFEISLETPRSKLHGDYSCTIALAMKKMTGLKDSREIAAKIVKYIPTDSAILLRTEVAGPGFLNFYLKPDWLYAALRRVEQEDQTFGFSETMAGENILIEFVSANPTGPISVVNGRAAVLGDVLGNLLASQGAVVSREFYINDALNSLQLEKFSNTVLVRYMQELGHPVIVPSAEDGGAEIIEPGAPNSKPADDLSPVPFPKDGYRGEYVRDIARGVVAESGDKYLKCSDEERQAYFRQATLNRMVAAQKSALEAFGIHFDNWFYESELYSSGSVEKTVQQLKDLGYAYEQDGALWLKSSALGDDKDRVLVRSNEKATYIAADTAYHHDKFERGFNHLINIWGADHHGYVARLKAGVAALGHDPVKLEIILTQMVSLVRDGEAVIGGKRKGNIIELKEDLIDDIGKDAARFYFLLNSYETPATVDVELAKKQSNDNPVYYVQYSHARLVNILIKAEAQRIALRPAFQTEAALLTHPAELDVLRKLADYPEEVAASARDYAPHRLTRFGMELASLLNVFYESCRVLPGSEEPISAELTGARLSLVNGARIVQRNLLIMLGISAPDKM